MSQPLEISLSLSRNETRDDYSRSFYNVTWPLLVVRTAFSTTTGCGSSPDRMAWTFTPNGFGPFILLPQLNCL